MFGIHRMSVQKKRNTLSALSLATCTDRAYLLHPRMGYIHILCNKFGKMSIISNSISYKSVREIPWVQAVYKYTIC